MSAAARAVVPPAVAAPAGPRRGVALLAALALLALIVLRLAQLAPPPVVPASAPADAFSAERAREHIAALAAAPRPTGSAGHAAARGYLLARLAALGIPGEIQRASVLGRAWGVPYDGARVENVVARLRGTEGAGALALIAHYDTVPNSPGAGDDASGVAVLLETLRALTSGPPLRNDVLFLFTDAEEGGALGAKAFVDEHPAARDVALAINFDARGNRGVVALFETSPDNGSLIDGVAQAAPEPIASSLFQEVARRLGHSTDLSVFKRAGIPSLNFAFSDGVASYHAPSDRPASLDLRSVQHAGEYALSLSRHFGDLDLRAPRRGDAVYFNTFGAHLVAYPAAWVIPLAALIALAFAAAVWLAVKSGAAGAAGIGWGLVASLATPVAIAAVTAALVAALVRLDPGLRPMRADPYEPALYRIGLSLLALAAAARAYCAARRRLGAHDLALAAMLVWLLLLAAASVAAPGASYFFAWPLLAALAGLSISVARRSDGSAPLNALVLVAAAVPAVAVAVPGPYLLFVALGLPRAAAPALVIALLAGLLAPQLELIGGGRSRRLAAALAASGAVALAAACASGGFSEAHPRPASLAYALDPAANRASWLTVDRDLDAWTASFFPAGAGEAAPFELPDQGVITQRSAAPALPITAPALVLLEDRAQDGARTLRMRVSSPRGAPWLIAFVASETEVVRAVVDGLPVEEPGGFRSAEGNRWGFTYMGVSPDGFEWALEVRGASPVEIRIVDRTSGLPHEILPSPRPANIAPVPFRIADATFIGGSFRF